MEPLPPPPYTLRTANFPLCLLAGETPLGAAADADGCARLDIAVGADGRVASVAAAGATAAATASPSVDLRGRLCLPLFADLHTHIGARRRSARRAARRGARPLTHSPFAPPAPAVPR